jgi:hypothetical protein
MVTTIAMMIPARVATGMSIECIPGCEVKFCREISHAMGFIVEHICTPGQHNTVVFPVSGTQELN